jgi:hypothetical protein
LRRSSPRRRKAAAVGIDIEHLRPLSPALVEAALRDDERGLLEELPSELSEEWLLRCWCAKEAAARRSAPGWRPAARGTGAGRGRPRRRAGGRGRGRTAVARAHPRDGELIVATTVSNAPGRGGRPVSRVDPEVLDGVLEMLSELSGDWEYDGEITPIRISWPISGSSRSTSSCWDADPAALRASPVPRVPRGARAAPGRGARRHVAEVVAFVCEHRQPSLEEV